MTERGQCGGTVILNVGGSIHQVKWETIDKFPKSRLQRLRYATSESKFLFLKLRHFCMKTLKYKCFHKNWKISGINASQSSPIPFTFILTQLSLNCYSPDNCPHSRRLFSGTILSLCDAFNLANREFYFDRSPRVFENILGLYRKGELHLTESVCPRDFLGELEYWGLSPLYLGREWLGSVQLLQAAIGI